MIHFNRLELVNALKLSQKAMNSKTTKPLLLCSVVFSDKDGCELVTTDEENTYVYQFQYAEVITPGIILVKNKMTHKILNKIKDDLVILSSEETDLLDLDETLYETTITSEKYKASFTVRAGSFAHEDIQGNSQKDEDFDEVATLEVKDVLKKFRAVKPCISKEETRYYLRGVYIESQEQQVTFTTTDGHRACHCPVAGQADSFEPFIFPGKAANLMEEIIKSDKGLKKEKNPSPVSLSLPYGQLGSKIIKFSYKNHTVYSYSVDGCFPDYKQVIPSAPSVVSFEVQGDELQNKLELAMITSPEATGGVRLSMSREKVEIHSTCLKTGTSSSIDVDTEDLEYTHHEEIFESGYNANYFLDGIKSSDSKNKVVTVKTFDRLSPATLTTDDILYVIMPMRL